MAENKATFGLNTPTVLLIAGGALFLINKIFGKSESDTKAESEENKITDRPTDKNPLLDSFKPLTTKPAGTIIIRGVNTIPAVPANYFSSAVVMIHNAIGTFTDDESAIMTAIKRAATQYELNAMAKVYAILYKKDLLTDLKDNLSSKELVPIYQHINKLPLYIKGTTKPAAKTTPKPKK
jgi:hypothetical protein